jgi:hypothetical protein
MMLVMSNGRVITVERRLHLHHNAEAVAVVTARPNPEDPHRQRRPSQLTGVNVEHTRMASDEHSFRRQYSVSFTSICSCIG